MIFERIEAICNSYQTTAQVAPPTLIYNEGWMLRLVLDRLAVLRHEKPSFKLAVPKGCAWYSEALLPSPFPSRSRADPQGESWTHVDGAVGHFSIGKGTKRNLELYPDATHFVIIEAKMFSGLAKGVKNASYYGQAARNIACMAKVLEKAKIYPEHMETLGFYVVAPDEQIKNDKKGLFGAYLDKDKIRNAVKRKVNEYKGDKIEQYEKSFERFIDRLDWEEDVKLLSWEGILEFLTGIIPDAIWLEEFYKRCKALNRPSASWKR